MHLSQTFGPGGERRRAALAAVLFAGALPLASGCTSVAQITTLSDPACHQSLTGALAAILRKEGETPEVAGQLAESAATGLEVENLGPRPFLIASSSGVDYSFFFEKKDDACLLRLYGRQKGFVSYTNNLTYIATEPVPGCRCAE